MSRILLFFMIIFWIGMGFTFGQNSEELILNDEILGQNLSISHDNIVISSEIKSSRVNLNTGGEIHLSKGFRVFRGSYFHATYSSSNLESKFLSKDIYISVYPNPAKLGSEMNFNIFLDEPSFVNIHIYDEYGRKIFNYYERQKESGEHIIPWNMDNYLKKGMYFCVINSTNYSITEKILIND